MLAQRGFTLIEVIIAMTIISLVSMQLYAVVQNNVVGVGRLEEKTLAHFVAMNRWVEMEVSEPWPNIGEKTQEVEWQEREWWVKTTVKNSPLPFVRQIEIDVSAKKEERTFSSDSKEAILSTLKTVATDRQ